MKNLGLLGVHDSLIFAAVEQHMSPLGCIFDYIRGLPDIRNSLIFAAAEQGLVVYGTHIKIASC